MFYGETGPALEGGLILQSVVEGFRGFICFPLVPSESLGTSPRAPLAPALRLPVDPHWGFPLVSSCGISV